MSSLPIPRSRTLATLATNPKTVCVSCPNAIWQITAAGKAQEIRVYCRLMHAIIDTNMEACDGNPHLGVPDPAALADQPAESPSH